MRISDLSPETLAAIRETRYDRIIEKHEGPATWDWELNSKDPETIARNERYKSMGGLWEDPEADAEFMDIGGHPVLLPVSADQHPNITVLRHFLSQDETQMVVYLKNTTYDDSAFGAGFVAICNRWAEGFYLATFYHEWFIIDYDPLADLWRKKAG